MEMLTGRLSDVRFGEQLQSGDVEIAGWLDLALDTSPALIVVGMNHPFVPSAVTGDPFLPGSLRTKLRMADNDRRYARDVYAMHLMVSTRQETRFIVGRTSADGSPTPPSRLMAAAAPADSARRVLHLLDSKRESVEVDHRWNAGPAVTNLPIPKLDAFEELQSIDAMSVTAFQLYLTCPYRFYLRYVLNCRPLSDDGTELAANQFGDLIHNTLDLFGNDLNRRDEPDPDKIRALMVGYLHDYAAQRYGESANTSVALQVAQAERRLEVVAKRQAERVAAGWRIQHAEKSAGKAQGSGIEVDGRWMTLKGRFDRIDYHPDTGRWAILDYKTHGELPEKKHFKRTAGEIKWLELQLPLYRMMAPFLNIDANPMDVELGYFNISQKDAETKINIADFGEDLMRQAHQKILQCIRDIWAGKFEPTDELVRYDDYDMILQTGVSR
jgi:ATP-dependent helicase/nuclease subunit B